jgi:hypothetical protein
VIVVSTPSAPTNTRPSDSVVVVAVVEDVGDCVVEVLVVSSVAADVVVSAVSPPHAAKDTAVARANAVRVLVLMGGYLSLFRMGTGR